MQVIGLWSISNTASLKVYKVEVDRMLVGTSFNDSRWHKIYRNRKHSYIIYGSVRFSLNDCMRIYR